MWVVWYFFILADSSPIPADQLFLKNKPLCDKCKSEQGKSFIIAGMVFQLGNSVRWIQFSGWLSDNFRSVDSASKRLEGYLSGIAQEENFITGGYFLYFGLY